MKKFFILLVLCISFNVYAEQISLQFCIGSVASRHLPIFLEFSFRNTQLADVSVSDTTLGMQFRRYFYGVDSGPINPLLNCTQKILYDIGNNAFSAVDTWARFSVSARSHINFAENGGMILSNWFYLRTTRAQNGRLFVSLGENNVNPLDEVRICLVNDAQDCVNNIRPIVNAGDYTVFLPLNTVLN